MSEKALLRVAVAVALAVLLWLGWRQVTPPERLGDVPYVPTRKEIVDRMLELAEVDADDLVFDLGSGDGRIVIRAAQRFGAHARGYELDPLLVRESRAAAARAGVDEQVEFITGDLFDADLHDATAVTLFLLPTVNLALRPRLLTELAPGTPVVSHMWDMGAWRPDVHEVLELEPPADVYLWIVPSGVGGSWRVEPAAGDDQAAARPIELRLLQRFQDLEGQIAYDGVTVPLSGAVRGSAVELAATRAHPELGRFSLTAEVEGDTLVGRARGGDGAEAEAFIATRLPARVEGAWQVGAGGEPFVPQWELTLSRHGDRWTARRGVIAGDASDSDGMALPGLPPPASVTAERSVSEIIAWGASIAFDVGAADGSARRVMYYGLVEGDRIFGFAHAGGRLVPWAARRAEGPR